MFCDLLENQRDTPEWILLLRFVTHRFLFSTLFLLHCPLFRKQAL